jgi:hypothetical protein
VGRDPLEILVADSGGSAGARGDGQVMHGFCHNGTQVLLALKGERIELALTCEGDPE